MGSRGPQPDLEKDSQVLVLRRTINPATKKHYTFDAISEKLGVSKPAVWKRYKRVVNELRGPVDK